MLQNKVAEEMNTSILWQEMNTSILWQEMNTSILCSVHFFQKIMLFMR